jgi:hypothetical protein
MIVLLPNQKCGVGRTAVALHFAGAQPCQSRPLTVIDADRKALRGTGPSSTRMFGYRATSPTRTHGRLMPATMQLTSNSKGHLSAARPNDQHPAGSARPHQGRMGSLPPARRTTLHKRTHHCDVGGEHE